MSGEKKVRIWCVRICAFQDSGLLWREIYAYHIVPHGVGGMGERWRLDPCYADRDVYLYRDSKGYLRQVEWTEEGNEFGFGFTKAKAVDALIQYKRDIREQLMKEKDALQVRISNLVDTIDYLNERKPK